MHRLPAQGVRYRLSSDAGVTLVETLISAVILVIVVGAVLTTIDASGRTTASNKNRSVGATLAEQDQERMRAMTPTQLDNYASAETKNVDGVPYNVESRAEWVFDDSGETQSCESSDEQADYLRISSTVTSSVLGTRVKPVVMRSLVSPRVESFDEDSGTLTVKVTDQLAQPVRSMRVTLSGAGNAERYTNEFGCAVFSHIPPGSYKATLNELGWVNEKRQRVYESPTTTVHVNRTTNVLMTYAKAASVTVDVKTDPGTGSVTSNAHAVSLENAKLVTPIVQPASPTTPATSITVTDLFPYPDGYTAYTGRCALNRPNHTSYSPANDDYFDTMPGVTDVTPGLPSSVDAHQPSVNLKAVAPDGTPLAGDEVRFTATSGCGSTSGTAKFVRTVGADGYLLLDRGLPFGDYTACVDRRISSTWYRRQLPFQNRAPGGTSALSLAVGSGSGQHDGTRTQCAA
jgi:Tfp pilus assembly protein PilV